MIMFELKNVCTNPVFKRYFSSALIPTRVLEKLNERSMISVVGEEAQTYLQGLITNDINHLSNNCSCLFAMFLNSKGRVLYDTIIYRIDPKTYFLECDNTLVHALEKHLRTFKLRRKIDIFPNDYQIHVMFNKQYHDEIWKNMKCSSDLKQDIEKDFCGLTSKSTFKLFKDPRVPQLGYRILSKEGSHLQSELSQLLNVRIVNSDLSYRKYRYSLGVGEGAIDLPTGHCFPLESNCDYLHGVSFHKGCYIGQELTARTYHTGVTRKRLMPIYFNKHLEKLPSEDVISGNNIKLRGLEGNVGLALLRLELVKTNSVINIAGNEAVVSKPYWWPIEAPKKNMELNK